MNNDRPNPDAALAHVQAQESNLRRGKLRIFFGYAAGVGKTFAMLEAARRERVEGVDVVAGYVEPHGRSETEALLEGLEVVSPRLVPYRSVTLQEFDLDAALARKPQLILVDELAHTNAEGSRHAKRWQDVEELLDAGIDVYTTLNVQHIESLNDVVAQITGTVVRETLPDSVLERADDIELIDLTPEELIQRLEEGKVYIPLQAERALGHFFQKSNLMALREISLRQAAQRLSRDVEVARRQKAAGSPWATSEHLLVCIGPSPTSAKLFRTAKRMAAAFGTNWTAVSVEPHGGSTTTAAARERIGQHLRLAERLGAETHTLVGDDVAQTLVDFARSRNVTKIVVGKTSQPRWKRFLLGTVVDLLLDRSGDIDVYVIRGESERSFPVRVPRPTTAPNRNNYIWTAIVVLVCGLLAGFSHRMQLTEANIVMVFLLGVVFVAARWGLGPAIAASTLSVLAFDFFFVPPYYRLSVQDAQYVVTFAVMLMIGIIISDLTARIRDQLRRVKQIGNRTAALFRLTRQLTEVAGSEFITRSAGQQLREIFDAEVVIFVGDSAGQLELRYGADTSIAKIPVNAVVAQWVTKHDQTAGAGTDTLPNATALFAPLIGSQGTVGAVGVKPGDGQQFSDPEQRRLLETCASLIALSLERDRSVLEAHDAQLQIQTEQLRNALLSSVSHDLRTPLAAIAGASSSLMEPGVEQDPAARHDLLQTLLDESLRLTRLVDNLLDMTRLESGNVALNIQWHVLEEIVGSALASLPRELETRPVRVDIPADLPLLSLDGVLIEQVLINILENAIRYTPAGTQIEISARRAAGYVETQVADSGPGLPVGSESRVFEKFYRGSTSTADGRRGIGLGLAICEGIVHAHGGKTIARNRPEGGAEFVISLPAQKTPPHVVLDALPAESHS